ncbi:hypothetical protein [Mangrovimonas sp. YM274]|uniref:alpha/beta hydrolase family protein n=1 Tax=Mangrovimonas sp. YM274 TaxID=3070660 RepID=UPI0027DC43B9|nr:hypothetical protein [Mangrovimonas sp. YM274]WMI68997.1 hypothetical protein RBH95_01185 [Mangrovimonas sp. YM274]
MRIFEILLLAAVTLLPFVKRPLLRRIHADYLLLFLCVLLALHLIVEGWRWQMVPAYVLLVLVAWRLKAVDGFASVKFSWFRGLGYVLLCLLLVIGWVLPMVLPVFSLPEPRGSYQVGMALIYEQTDRDEEITEDPNDKRELLYKIWYPSEADITNMKSEPYVDQASRAGFATKYGLPPVALDYLDKVQTYVYPGISVAHGRFPVVLFSHGYGSKATGYYALLSELASQGYIVVNMNHTYESLGVSFPDGHSASFDYDYQRRISANAMATIEPIANAFKQGLNYEERHPIVREAIKDYFEGAIQERWAQDMIGTIDLLEEWNAKGPLKGALDLERLGVFGHSVGGGAAGKVAMNDKRIKAAANLDGIQWGTMIDSSYHVPYLYLSADWPAEHEDINAHVYAHKSQDLFYECKLLQSGHPNFMDIPFMVPVPSLAGTGTINPYEGMEITSALVTSFFDTHLKQLPNTEPEKLSAIYDLLELRVYEGGEAR